jgi:hypothetical protein
MDEKGSAVDDEPNQTWRERMRRTSAIAAPEERRTVTGTRSTRVKAPFHGLKRKRRSGAATEDRSARGKAALLTRE